MKKAVTIALALLFVCASAYAQSDRKCVRKGNRDFAKSDWRSAAVDYGTAVAADTTSFSAQYNLASTLYRMENWQGASQALSAIKESQPQPGTRAAERTDKAVEGEVCNAVADYWYNVGDVAIKSEDWQGAVQAFKQSLLLNPADVNAKENYIYAKLKLQNQQNGGGGGSDNQQDQDNQDQDQNQNQDQQDQNNQNQNQDQQDQQQQPQQQEAAISPQQAKQMLKAIQEAEKKTQDKVKEEKAALLQSRQKDKNW